MSRKEIVHCDICGIEKQSLGKHWSSGIYKLLLQFKRFPNIQRNILIEDCCTNCAESLYGEILKKIEQIKELKGEK